MEICLPNSPSQVGAELHSVGGCWCLSKKVFSQKTAVSEGSGETRVWGRNVIPFVLFEGFCFPSLALLWSSMELGLPGWQCSHGKTTIPPTLHNPHRGFAAHPLHQQPTVKQQMPQGRGSTHCLAAGAPIHGNMCQLTACW